jgi:hypothetical protein
MNRQWKGWAIGFALAASSGPAQYLLIPMDLRQADHLKAYGAAFAVLERGLTVEWLLNYRCGSFLLPEDEWAARRCRTAGVIVESVSAAGVAAIREIVSDGNMESVLLEKAPRIAVYTPPDKRPWDDAVTLALTYAEIPYRTVWDEEVLDGKLAEYDWLHLHHEDFTGQYGKFYRNYRNAEWYVKQKKLYETMAKRLGFQKVSKMKLTVAQMIRQYVTDGGFLFAMCSATDTFDIALAAERTDICEAVFDGDPAAADWPAMLDDRKCLAFEKFQLITDPAVYEYSDIDTTPQDPILAQVESDSYFTLFDFSAKYDPVPAMLTQDHTAVIHEFMGQTTGFRRSLVKPAVTVLAEKPGSDEVKYIHGDEGRGTWTFLGGHDPEDYHHFVGDRPTDLSFHRNSPGYRLILNNILFPAARKKERKT